MSAELNSKLGMSLDDISRENAKNGTGGRFPRERRARDASPRNETPYSRGRKEDETQVGGEVTNRVYVGNLSYQTSWQGLKDYFKTVGNVIYADVLREDNGRSKGCGIVEFETREEALGAIKALTNTELDGRPIFVREDREDKKAESFRAKHKSTAGAQVFVSNLPYETSWQDLKDEFRKVGEVVRAEILMAPDGRSKGSGTVLFETVADASRAIREYDSTTFHGRVISVREDKFA